ncbi:LCP family protein [Limosilactobacillus antri]|uniref:LCP family glycopolymer transferase n=1 Tax=Limosilactobacillus antri TaxID=227943 RepID=UPI001F56E8C2|nr:LCP family protein [Limosilactobacillus antri]
MNKHDEEQFERRSDYRQQAERPRRHRGWKIFGWLVLLLAVIAGIYAFLAWHNVKVTTNQMFNSSGATRQRDAQKVLDQRRPVSILLLGTDTGALGRSYKGRTDTVMIMTINPQTQQTKIVSIPRDMKVNLPGYPEDSPAKINAAYTFGGVKETINVIQKHFNIPIDYYVLVNMGGLKQAINQVGGVTVTSPLTFDYEGSHFEKGESYHLNGTTALKFSRMRYDDPQGDYGRQQRQKLIIEALLKKSVSYKTVLNRAFLKSISHNSKTDLTFDDMLQLARHYRKATKNVSQDHAQGEGESSDGQAFEVVPQDEQQRISNLLRKSLGLDPANLDAEN